jgi:WD40 repeat protein
LAAFFVFMLPCTMAATTTQTLSAYCAVPQQIWDVTKLKRTRTMGGHRQRVGTQAWSSHMLSSGSRDKSILLRDVRVPEPYVEKLLGHKSEVCGLKVGDKMSRTFKLKSLLNLTEKTEVWLPAACLSALIITPQPAL